MRGLAMTLMMAFGTSAWATCGAPSGLVQQMDAASKTFHSAQADVQYDNYTRVVRAHDIETGSIYIERAAAGGLKMGALFFAPGSKTPSKIVAYDNSTLQYYTTGTNQLDVFKAGANRAKYDGFLTLGFGGSGQALCDAWEVTDNGPEKLDGTTTEKLDLVSKDPGVKGMFNHVTIWVDTVRDVSLKQQFFAPNGDYRTATYTNIRLNTPIDKKPYAIAKGAQRVNH